MTKKYTLEQVNEIIIIKNIKLLDYSGYNVVSSIKCLICNKTWKTTPCSVIRLSGCPHCAIEKRKIKLEQIQEIVKSKNKIIECLKLTTISKRTTCYLKCNTCQFSFTMEINHLKCGKHIYCRNANCQSNNDRREKISEGTKKQKNKEYKENGSKWEIIGTYINLTTKTQYRCNQCGNVFNYKPAQITKHNKTCNSCYFYNKREKYKKWIDDMGDYKKYRDIVNYLTFISNEKYTKFTNIGIKHYHIDHIYSVKECFINGILPEVAANPCNLQKLWHKKNLKKQANCWITKEEMLDRYHTWLKRNPTYIQDLKNNQNIIFPERFKYNDYYMQNIIK